MRHRILPLFLLATLAIPTSAWAQERDDRLQRARSLTEEAWKDVQAGQPQQAIVKAREALEIRERTLGPSHPGVAGVLQVLGQALNDSGDSAGARAALERALAIREQALGPTHEDVGSTLNALGWALYAGEDYVGARRALERSLSIRKQALGPKHPQTSVPLYRLGVVASASGDYPAARAAYEEALAIREQALGPSHPDVAAVLNSYGVLLRNLGDYPGARAALERALAIREKALGPTHPEVAATLDELGTLLRLAGDTEAGRPLVERALAIRVAAYGPASLQAANSLNSLGWALFAGGDYAGAMRAFEQALAIRQRALGPKHVMAARSLFGLGTVASVKGEYPTARTALEQSLAILEQAQGPSSPEVATILIRYGFLLRVLGDYAGARAALERALAIREQAFGSSHPEVAAVLTEYGALLRWIANFAGARALLERALSINERAFGPDHRNISLTLYHLAYTQAAVGDLRTARVLADRELAIAERTLGPDHSFVAESLTLVASLCVMRGDFPGAKPLLERALVIQERTLGLKHRHVAFVLMRLAQVYRINGNMAEARRALQRSLAIREEAFGPDHSEVAGALNALGELYLRDGDAAGAQPLLSRSLAITSQVTAPDVRWRAESGLGLIKEREQNWAEAVSLYRAAVKDLEDLAGQFRDEADREQFLQWGNRLTPYDALARTLLKLHEQDQSRGYDREAWAILDAKKRRVTAETLSAARPTPRDPKALSEMQSAQAKRDEAVALERSLREEQARALQEQQPEAIRSLTTRLAQTKAEYLAQVRGFLQRYPQYKSQFVDQQTVDPKALAKFADRLPKDTLAVQYFAAPDQLYVFVVAPGGKFQVKAQAVSQAKLFGLVKQYRELVERGVSRPLPWSDDGSEAYRQDVAPLKAVMRELSEHLLRPIEAELRSVQGLILIPNDLLLYLPFHALMREAPDGAVRFLAETHAVSYVTQLELTDLLGPGAAAPDAPLLAVANPDGSLPAATREVRALARIRPAVTTLDGPQATKASFLRQAAQFPDLHLATHGVLDPQHPEHSYLLFAGEDEVSQRLGIGEIAGLSLHSGLTVLSACETALGEQVPGAALITLAAAFSQAGSQSIVASLWRVNDSATRDFMVAFHTNLPSGRAAALRKAQITLLANRATAHPYYWATFILLGAR